MSTGTPLLKVLQIREELHFICPKRKTVKIHVQWKLGSRSVLCGASFEKIQVLGQKAAASSLCERCYGALRSITHAIERTYTSQEYCPRCHSPLVDAASITDIHLQPGICQHCMLPFDSGCLRGDLCVFCDSAQRAAPYTPGNIYLALCVSEGSAVLLSVRWQVNEELYGSSTRKHFQLVVVRERPSIHLEDDLAGSLARPDRPCDGELRDQEHAMIWIISQQAWDAINEANTRNKHVQEIARRLVL